MAEPEKKKMKGGRTPLPEEQKATKRITLRLTAQDYDKLEKKRELSGEEMAVFVRKSVLRSNWQIRSVLDEGAASLIRRASVNINQMAKHLNRGGLIETEMLNELKTINSDIKAILKEIEKS